MTRFIFVRVGALLLIIATFLLVARYFILQSLSCVPVCISVNLIGRDMRNVDLSKVNFTEANLRSSNFTGANLRWSDLSGARLSGAVLAKVDLRGAKLIGADLRGVDLRGALLSGADLSGAVLDGADMTQLDLTKTQLGGVSFISTKLVEANLSNANLPGIDLVYADLSGANLTSANLAGTSLSRADLSGAILVDSDLAGSWINLANLTGADLSGADLSGSSLIGANLASARLTGARLIGASLVGALFLGTDLRSASLQGIRLVVSELQPQDLLDPELANLNELQRRTLIVDANLRGVQYNDQTQWPSGKLVLLAGLLGQEFAEAVAAQQVAEPTPEPTPLPEEEVSEAPPEIIGQPEEAGPAITFALSGPGSPVTKNLYDLFQSQGYTNTIGFRDVENNNAIDLLCTSGEVDVILLARRMTTSELEACTTAGHELVSIEVGTTVLVFIVDPTNAFLTDIATSEIPLLLTAEKWVEVRPDWPDEPIMRFLTNEGSGVLSFIKERFFADSESDPLATAPNSVFNPDEIQLVQAIVTTPNALGFFSLNNYTQNAEILKLVTIDGITPSTTTVASGVYSLTQPLMFYGDLARMQEKPEAGYFLWFHLDNVNALLERAGFALASPAVMELSRENLAAIPSAPPAPGADETTEEGTPTPEAGEASPEDTPRPEAAPTPEATPTPVAEGESGGDATVVPTPTLAASSGITETILARLTATATAVVTPTLPAETPAPVEEAPPTATSTAP